MRPDNRCLALVTDAFGGNGGIAQYNCDFLAALVQSVHGASIDVLPRYGPQQTDPPPGITQLPPRGSRIGYGIAAIWFLRLRRIPVIFCGHLHLAALAGLVARLTKAKLIVQMHGIEAWPSPSRMRRSAVESADLVLCVSRYTRAAVLGWAAIAPERVIVVPNTVDEQYTPGDGSVLRRQLGLEDKRVLLTVGRMDSRERYKGHDRVIAAMPQLLAQGHDIVYVIAGEGEDRARLENLAAGQGVAERVRFLGQVEPRQLVEAYRMADLFVMPSTGEGFGIAFLEAMACGTPALGLNVAGAVDALADGELGTVTSERDLPAAIARLLGRTKSDAGTLAAAVRRRFGRDVFDARIRSILGPLFGAAI
ncbi:MAG TPA: glycosyltransferase family 4 protein [Xanthobacteraceae bacterium]|jgi:phosphatidylinositol alpha-1,6-mannosyltransferase